VWDEMNRIGLYKCRLRVSQFDDKSTKVKSKVKNMRRVAVVELREGFLEILGYPGRHLSSWRLIRISALLAYLRHDLVFIWHVTIRFVC
jgi:hypothetical protein